MKLYTFFKIYRKYKEETVAIFSRLGNCKFHEEGNCVLYITSSRASFGLILRAGSLCGAFSEPLYIITIYMILIVNYQYQPKHIYIVTYKVFQICVEVLDLLSA